MLFLRPSRYLFGGMAGTKLFGDLWVLETQTMEWSEHDGSPGVAPEPQQASPAARSGHAAAVVGESMYVMGGLSLHEGQPAAMDDLWCLDSANLVWAEPKLDTAPINGRIGHSMCAVKNLTGIDDGMVAAAATDGGGGSTDVKPSEPEAEATEETKEGTTADGDGAEPVITDVTPMFSDTLPIVPKVATVPAVGASDPVAADALLVFGGMDMAQQFFEDCALLRP